jgi:hypothetical protein
VSNSFHGSYSSAVITSYVPLPLHSVRLAGFRLIEAGLPETLDVDCQPSLTMCCSLEIEWRAVHPGLVHMVQLGSKTGATLAGKVVSLFLRNISHSPLYHLVVTLIIPLTHPFLDYFVLRYGEIRIGFQCFNICRQGAPCKIVMWTISCCPFCTLWLFQFEQSLRNADDRQNLHQQSIAQTTIVYYCSRMEAVSLMSRQNLSRTGCTGAESCA